MTDTATKTTAPTATVTTPEKSGAWRTPDWLNVILGIIMASTPLWMTDPHPAWQIPLGLAIIAVALWALATNSSLRAEKTMSLVAAVTFLSPFLGVFGTPAATWFAWITGGLLFAVAMYSLNVRTLRG
jgi:hypothetical protein